MDKDYEEFKKELVFTSKGKLTSHKDLILQMIEDGLTQKDMMKFLKNKYNLSVTQSNFSLFIKKLKSSKIVKMEIINGTNFVAAPTTPIKEKKIKPRKVDIPENETNSKNNNEQTISKKLVLNLPNRNIDTGELKQVDISQFK